MPDASMEIYLLAAGRLKAPAVCPEFLRFDSASPRKTAAKRAVFIMAVETTIADTATPMIKDGAMKHEIAGALATSLVENSTFNALTACFLHDISDPAMRVNVSLRLYAGYLDTAKTIADRTAEGDNSAVTRARDMPTVDKRASDPIYLAGVQAAPFYKRAILQQAIFNDGIPDGSPVLDIWVNPEMACE